MKVSGKTNEEFEHDLDLIRNLPKEFREYNEWRKEWNITEPERFTDLLPGLSTALSEYKMQTRLPI